MFLFVVACFFFRWFLVLLGVPFVVTIGGDGDGVTDAVVVVFIRKDTGNRRGKEGFKNGNKDARPQFGLVLLVTFSVCLWLYLQCKDGRLHFFVSGLTIYYQLPLPQKFHLFATFRRKAPLFLPFIRSFLQSKAIGRGEEWRGHFDIIRGREEGADGRGGGGRGWEEGRDRRRNFMANNKFSIFFI